MSGRNVAAGPSRRSSGRGRRPPPAQHASSVAQSRPRDVDRRHQRQVRRDAAERPVAERPPQPVDLGGDRRRHQQRHPESPPWPRPDVTSIARRRRVGLRSGAGAARPRPPGGRAPGARAASSRRRRRRSAALGLVLGPLGPVDVDLARPARPRRTGSSPGRCDTSTKPPCTATSSSPPSVVRDRDRADVERADERRVAGQEGDVAAADRAGDDHVGLARVEDPLGRDQLDLQRHDRLLPGRPAQLVGLGGGRRRRRRR